MTDEAVREMIKYLKNISVCLECIAGHFEDGTIYVHAKVSEQKK